MGKVIGSSPVSRAKATRSPSKVSHKIITIMSDLRVFNQTITNVKTQEYLKSVLGEKKDAFVNNMTALVANNKMLQDCEPLTLMYAGMKATALGLPLDQNLGFAYVLPYKNTKNGTTEAQLQFGYAA